MIHLHLIITSVRVSPRSLGDNDFKWTKFITSIGNIAACSCGCKFFSSPKPSGGVGYFLNYTFEYCRKDPHWENDMAKSVIG